MSASATLTAFETAFGEGVVAQASFTLAFDPDGRSLRMSVESKGEMVLVGIPGTRDSTVFETFALGGVTQRAERIGDDRFSFDVTYERLFRADGDRLTLRADSASVVTVDGLDSTGVSVYDVTDRRFPRVVDNLTIEPAGAGFQVSGSLVAVSENAGTFHDDIDVEFAPRQLGWVTFGQYLDWSEANIDRVAVNGYRPGIAAVHGIIFQHVRIVLGRAKVINSDNL